MTHDHGTQFDLPDGDPTQNVAISYILAEDSEIMPWLRLRDAGTNQTVLHLTRTFDQLTDKVELMNDQNWINQLPQDAKGPISVKLISLARKHLRVSDVEASFSGGADSDWTRYRDSQQAILNSLEETQRNILVDYAKKSAAAEVVNQEKLNSLESELRSSYKAAEAKLSQEHDALLGKLADREAALTTLEQSFNTKEARYVARKGQEDQINQIKGWLEGWSLTPGTEAKRWPVLASYAAGIVLTGALAVLFSYQNVEILTGKDLTQVLWWQWGLLSLKSIFPAAAFTTFVVYFIRWTSSWARQHSEEEFRNRARILDIGRTSWLLEAVRDAQDNGKELPPDLIKELSRNLFAYAPPDIADIHPQAVTDLIMQGLSSLRVKIPDGTEVEAKRGKG